MKKIEIIKINDSVVISKAILDKTLSVRGYNQKIINKIGKILLKLDKDNRHKYADDDVYVFKFSTWFHTFHVFYSLFPKKKVIAVLEIITWTDMIKEYNCKVEKKDIFKPGILK